MVEQNNRNDQKDPRPEGAEGETPVSQEAAEKAAEEKTADLEEALTTARAESARNWDLYLRERAELENYRKRMQREKEDLARFANENLLREILPILDNLERAVSHSKESAENDAAGLLKGVEMTLDQFHKVLEKFGVVPVESVGKPFDPAWHEAMGQLESREHAPNTVVQQMQKGFTLNDRLLRPALVLVAKAPPGE
ncbi:MAG: nucleotide exchange factor GrpE [Syntrophotaleaceae bacterium]